MNRQFAVVFLLAFSLAAAGSSPQTAAPPGKDSVAYIPAKALAAALAKPSAATLLQRERYQVMINRRTGPGQSELHEADTDIFYVLDGSATLTTGGTVAGGKTTAPGEIRGTGIQGGQAYHLSKGDIITIPRRTPHWFSEVRGTFDYLIIKVR